MGAQANVTTVSRPPADAGQTVRGEHGPAETTGRPRVVAVASDPVTLADIRRRLQARVRPIVSEAPTAANLPVFLKQVRNGEVDDPGPRFGRTLVTTVALLGLAVLTWITWNWAPPVEWLRDIGPAIAQYGASGSAR